MSPQPLRLAVIAPLLTLMLIGAAGTWMRGRGAPVAAPSASALVPPGDTQAVYGPRAFDTPTGSATNHVERFALAVQPGRRYTLRVANGNADGSGRVTGGSLILNGGTILSSSDLASGAAAWTRVVQALTEDTIRATVQGPAGARVTVTLESTADPSFPVFGPEHFVRNTGTPVTETRQFTISATAGSPYRMCIINGNADGTNRLSSATIVLNGVTVLSQNELNQQVAGVMKDVTLQAQNTVLITLTAKPQGFLDLCFTATDVTPPVITIVQPPSNFVTNEAQVAVSGNILDETPTTVAVNGQPATLTGTSFTATVPLGAEGSNVIHVVATDAAGHTTDSTRTVIHDTQAPVLLLTSPADGFITRQPSVTVSGTVTDLTLTTVNVNGIPFPVDGAGQFTGSIALTEGANVVMATATDAAGNQTVVIRSVTLDTQAPVLVVSAPADGAVINADHVTVTGTVTDATPVTVTANGTSLPVAPDHSFGGDVALLAGPNTITVVATDAATNASTVTRSVTRPTGGLPPDPIAVASVVNRAEVTTIADATAFLYSGTTPIQTGVAAGTINAVRAAVVRGRVLDRTFAPVGGAAVTILGHPELGQTLSRADGGYDLAVNGGLSLTVNFAKAGYFPAQRTTEVSWQDYTTLDDVILLQPDPAVTVVDLTAPTPARGSVVSDADGARQATVIFKPGNTATLTLADGTTQPLTTLTVRATEYTVGDSGMLAMPAPLPPASQYTYAVSVSVDEQLAAGPGAQVTFAQPVPFYVENFLHIPDGSKVPVGMYDPAQGIWVPQPNGVALKVVAVVNGRAQLDITGDGVADPPSALAALGIDDFEQVQLAGLYPSGSDLWRALIPRPAPLDLNLPFVFVGTPPADGKVRAGCSSREGDPIRCQLQAQTAFQRVGIVGSPFTLNYASDRTKGNAADRKLDITLTGPTLPAQLLRVDFEVDVAGKRFQGSFTPQPNLTYTFNWDGKDIYNRLVQGTQPATVLIGYVFPILYASPANAIDAFGLPCAPSGAGSLCQILANPQTGARAERTLVQRLETSIGTFDATALGLGGFSLDVQHVYDPVGEVLYKGDGTRRATAALPPGIKTVIGGCPSSCLNGNQTGPALRAQLGQVFGMVFNADGTLYFSDASISGVRRVTPDGIISLFAGGCGIFCPFSDSGPALQMNLGIPRGLAWGPDGSLYIADGSSGSVVRRMRPNGTITIFAGTRNNGGFAGDGGPAKAAKFQVVSGLAMGPDGSLYIGDRTRVRRVDPNGIITTFAGTGDFCQQGSFAQCGDGGLATKAWLGFVSELKFGPDGALYVAENGFDFRVRRIGPDGIIKTVAGSSAAPGTGDGGLATLAGIIPVSIDFGPDGSLYIGEGGPDAGTLTFRVRRVTPNGIITTFAGTGAFGFSGDGGPAPAAQLGRAGDVIGIGPDGNLYTGGSSRIRKVTGFLPGFGVGQTAIASEDGSEIYVFSTAGRLLFTLDASTRDTVYRFDYDPSLRLISITDRYGRVTLLERDATGAVSAILPPSGQTTTLAIDGNVLSVADPDGHSVRLAMNPDGLLIGFTDQNGAATENTYDAAGRLATQMLPDSGTTTITTESQGTGSQTSLESPDGVGSVISTTTTSTGAQVTTTRSAGGLVTTVTRNPNGTTVTLAPNGVVTTETAHADPRTGMEAPLEDVVFTLPSGLTLTRRTAAAVVRDAFDDLVSETDSIVVNSRPVVITYNHQTNRGAITTPGGRSRVMAFDANGLLIRDSIPGFLPTIHQYDAAGRDSVMTQGGRAWRYTYDAHGRLATATNPLGFVKRYAYDGGNRLSLTVSPMGDSAFSAYDFTGQQIAHAPPERPPHRFAYAPTGLPASYELPDAGQGTGVVRTEFNLDGFPIRMIRAAGDTVTVSYDSFGRTSTMRTAEGVFSYAYDPLTGRLHTVTSPNSGSLTYQFDGFLPTVVTWAGLVSGSVSTSYSSDFRPASQQVNGANLVAFGYDADGLVTTAGAMTLARDPGRFLVSGTTLGSVTTATTYDAYGAVQTFTARYAGNTIAQLTYERDSMGRIGRVTEQVLGTTTTFGAQYDSVGRLAVALRDGIADATYEYDANGNRIRSTSQTGQLIGIYDARDRLTTYGSASYGYTPDGYLAYRASGVDTTRYRFAALGELLEVDLPDNTNIQYVIDAKSRRVGKRVNGVLTRAWLYDGNLAVVAELDAQGQVRARFIYGEQVAGTNVPEYMVRDGVNYRLISDHLGSVRLVVDAVSGSVVQRIEYDAFGRVTLNTNPGFQPFGFAGGLYDDDTKLTHFAAREYDAEVGRWISKDPLLFNGGAENLYVYVGNDPVNLRDPSGTQTLVETEKSLETNEELEKDEYKRKKQERENVMKAVCKTLTTLVKVTGQVHHVMFRALGGGDEGNRVWILTEIHRAFHSYMYSIFAGAGLPAPNAPARVWEELASTPAGREAIKGALRTGADAFDRFCADRARLVEGPGRGGIGGFTTMRSVLDQYFKDIGW